MPEQGAWIPVYAWKEAVSSTLLDRVLWIYVRAFKTSQCSKQENSDSKAAIEGGSPLDRKLQDRSILPLTRSISGF